jgi:branched-chain amino acid transport system substrate-binding protein
MRNFKLTLIFSLILILLGNFFLGCKKEPKVIKIGAILPLTGPAAFYGEWGKKGIDLAVDEINSSGGINNKKLMILYGDSKNDMKEGVSWANKMAMEKVSVIISAMTGVSFSIIPIAEQRKIVLFMTIVTHPEAADKSEWAFRHYVNKGKAAQKMANFAYHILNLRKIAILYINDEGGLGEKNSFKMEFEKLGGKIVGEESFEKNANDLKPQLLKISNLKPEAIYFSGYGKIYGVGIRQIKELKIQAKVLASYEPLYKTTQELAGDALEGIIFTSPYFEEENPKAQKFIEQYMAKYGERPEIDAAFGYDVIMLLAKVLKEGTNKPEYIKNNLLKIKDYPGVVGKISILPNGDTEIPIVIKTFKNGKIITLTKPYE